MRIRLDKYLADLGIESRSGVKLLIKKGRVQVNGTVWNRPETKVDTEADQICLDGRNLTYYDYEYFMLNKPAGVVSASRDPRSLTVLDLIDSKTRKDLFPVGRLDRNTTGLLLVTNDGALAHCLLAPGRHVEKVYRVQLDGAVESADQTAFREGIDIGDDTPTLPAMLEIPDASRPEEVLVRIHEGRYHQIKRMFAARGRQVVGLKRLSMGPLLLDDTLEEGESRRLTGTELAELKSLEHH
ncbi:MAG TPA: 16S rRNA pseudouridine(516) synthase [Lachnospiraceae bacterium]|nr:16S rRNA pseudouridine(516) synthase [Lachnospiraceae bacterium]